MLNGRGRDAQKTSTHPGGSNTDCCPRGDMWVLVPARASQQHAQGGPHTVTLLTACSGRSLNNIHWLVRQQLLEGNSGPCGGRYDRDLQSSPGIITRNCHLFREFPESQSGWKQGKREPLGSFQPFPGQDVLKLSPSEETRVKIKCQWIIKVEILY